MRDQLALVLREEAEWIGSYVLLAPDEETEGHMADMDAIQSAVKKCRLCRLSETRKNTVFGQGPHDAAIMFVGEAPGAREDETGQVFIGSAGNLLTDIIEKGMGLKRSDVYIANILKCRPPDNRDPLPDEVKICMEYLKAQIRLISPRLIITLGQVASQSLLDTKTPISALRGRFAKYSGIDVMPTYHPSYLLQNPSKKRDVWEDIKKVMYYLNMPIPG